MKSSTPRILMAAIIQQTAKQQFKRKITLLRENYSYRMGLIKQLKQDVKNNFKSEAQQLYFKYHVAKNNNNQYKPNLGTLHMSHSKMKLWADEVIGRSVYLFYSQRKSFGVIWRNCQWTRNTALDRLNLICAFVTLVFWGTTAVRSEHLSVQNWLAAIPPSHIWPKKGPLRRHLPPGSNLWQFCFACPN